MWPVSASCPITCAAAAICSPTRRSNRPPRSVSRTAVTRRRLKIAEAQRAIADGCEELDMVVNISKVISGDWAYVGSEIGSVIQIAHDAGQKVKVIFENCYLNDEQKIRLCEICGGLSADWVKTSTGYGTGGATIEDLKLMRANSPDHVQVKAAGGIRDLDKLLEVRALGVTRVGASRTAEMLNEGRKRLNLDLIETRTKSAAGY